LPALRSRGAHPSPSKTRAGQAGYMAAYDAALRLWPIPYRSLELPTRWGPTHILASGPADAPPLVLLHGMGLSATMWFPNAADLGRNHRLYAVDTIGTAGKSLAVKPLRGRADCAAWLRDVLDGLGIAQTHLLGHSHGGWLALNFASRAPERVKRLILLAPAASFLPLVPRFYLQGIPTLLYPRPSLVARFMRWMTVDGFVVHELFLRQFVLGMRHLPPRLGAFPTVFSDDELQHITAHTLLLVGKNEVLYNPVAAVDRAGRLVPHIQAELIPNAGHGLPMEQPTLVDERILRFLDREQHPA
jgi:pimeloyl-ACP methyl ester carboxylesterase